VLPSLLGVPMREEYRLEAGGREYLVTHGDRFDPALASELPRNVAGWFYQTTRKMNKKWARWLKKYSARWGGQLAHIRRQAADYARQQGCGGVLIGHTHHADDAHLDGVHYVNTGCWTESPCAYVTAERDALQLHQLHE
jgi:UDP-2,3-diacylglucosamine pyrophosphatase LpxH